MKHCEQITEYIKVSEVVQMMEELVTFTKNLSPGKHKLNLEFNRIFVVKFILNINFGYTRNIYKSRIYWWSVAASLTYIHVVVTF